MGRADTGAGGDMSLHTYQSTAANHLAAVILSHSHALDASDTGVGKTYTALGVAQRLGAIPLVVAPKVSLPTWQRVSDELGVPILGAINPEKLKTGRTEWLKKGAKKKEYLWMLPAGRLVIFDEVHRYGGTKTENGSLLAFTKPAGLRTLSLSATVAESPLRMRALGYLFGFHQYRNFWSWCLANGCYKNRWGGIDFYPGGNGRLILEKIHHLLFPTFGTRLRIADLPDFPENEVIAESFDLDRNSKEIQAIYDKLSDELKKPGDSAGVLTQILRARQQIEWLKLPTLVDMASDLVEEGNSVVIFVSFRDTIEGLKVDFPNAAVIWGEQSANERQLAIDDFQANRKHVMLATVGAGGLSVSLHDLQGRPRRSLITPPYSAVELQQCLGRIHRNGARSKAVQRIVFAAGTVEEEACKAVRRKLGCLAALNDGDLTGGMPWASGK